MSDIEIKQRVQQVLADQLYATGIPMMLVSYTSATAVAVGVWLATGAAGAWIWLALVVVAGAPRFALVRGYRRARDRSPRRWQRRFAIHAGVYGFAWGQAALLMFGHDPLVDQILMLTLSFKVLGGFQANYAYKPAFFAFSLALVLPPALRQSSGSVIAHAQGATALLFLFAAVVMLRRFHALLVESVEGRLRNEDLARQNARERDLAIEARRIAEEATRSKSHFLAAASHDLRQPLYAQSLFIAALRRELPEGYSGYLAQRIGATGDALRSLLDGMLDVSRLDAGVVQVDLRPFPLQPLFDEVARELEPLATRRGLRLRVPETSVWVQSDRTLVQRIVRNLATNAIQHTERGGVLIGARRGDRVRIAIFDTGPGIAPADRDRIFDEFVQLGNPERDRARGVGLGLSIVRRLARQLGTEVALRSEVGRGSQFWVELPSADPIETAVVSKAEPRSTRGGLHVLVIDDEADVRDGMTAALSAWGLRVTTADSGDRAITALGGATPPDVIVADFRLRANETGIAAIERVRSVCQREIPAMLITGDTHADRLAEAMASGLRVLHKPITPEALRAALDELPST